MKGLFEFGVALSQQQANMHAPVDKAELSSLGYKVTPYWCEINQCDLYSVTQGSRLIIASNDEADAWRAAAEDAESDSAGPCQKCGDADTEFRSGSFAGMDVTCRECNACGHQWDHT